MTEHFPPPTGAFLRPVGHYAYSYKVLSVHAPSKDDPQEVVVFERWGLKDGIPIDDGHVKGGFSIRGLRRVLPDVWKDAPAFCGAPLYYRLVKMNQDPISRRSILHSSPRSEFAKEGVSPGYVLVDVVLPAHQAFIARRWAEQAKEGIRAHARVLALSPGQRCTLVETERTKMQGKAGVRVIVTKVFPETRQVFAHDDEPVRFKVNGRGRKVVAFDPACIETVYGFDELRPVTEAKVK